MRNLWLRGAVAAAALFMMLTTAEAHKLKVFATVEGTTINAYAYFSPGGRARAGAVTVTAPDGSILYKTDVGDDGNFQIPAKQRIDHTITVDAGDGHVASYTVHAADLPNSLPAPTGPANAGTAVSAPASAAPTVTGAPPVPGVSPIAPGPSDAAILAAIDHSVARQIRPLREELDEAQEKIWVHDVLGGLGYILGLGGLAYGLSERRRRAAPRSFAERLPAE